MTDAKKDALETLKAEVDGAKAKALGNPLWKVDPEELEARAVAHGDERNETRGTSVSGWLNPYPDTDPRSFLTEYQFCWTHDRSPFKMGVWGRQTGKDFSSQCEIAEDCFARPGTRWTVAAPSERQSLESLEQGKTWVRGFGLMVEDYEETREGADSESLLKVAEITLSNGSKIRAVPGKASTARGISSNVLITEFDHFEDAPEFWQALIPSITNPIRGGRKKARVITTPNGNGSAGHKIWESKDGKKLKWSRHLVSLYHAVLMGLPVDVELMKEVMEAAGDLDSFAQEFLCKWIDASTTVFPYDVIAHAEHADATESWDPNDAGTSHPTFCGVDFGRINDPTVCWTFQRVGGILWTREVLVLEKVSSPDQEMILRDRIAAADRTCFDYTGPGIGLGDYLVRTHGEWKPKEHKGGKVELCTFTPAFKRELFPRLLRSMEAPTEIRIPISTAIREDFHEVKQVVRGEGFFYTSKKTKLGHSDRCTACALARRAAGDMDSGPFKFESVKVERPDALAGGRRVLM